MTRKHHSPEYHRNARIIRKRVAAMHKAGMPALCWRGGGAIPPGMPYDVGHRNGVQGSSLGALAPEHRHRMPGCCDGNRREGGRAGAILTGKARARTVPAGSVQSWPL